MKSILIALMLLSSSALFAKDFYLKACISDGSFYEIAVKDGNYQLYSEWQDQEPETIYHKDSGKVMKESELDADDFQKLEQVLKDDTRDDYKIVQATFYRFGKAVDANNYQWQFVVAKDIKNDTYLFMVNQPPKIEIVGLDSLCPSSKN